MREPSPRKPVVIHLPTATPDQLEYLQEIADHAQESERMVRGCICKFGGAGVRRSYKSDPACPIHGSRKGSSC